MKAGNHVVFLRELERRIVEIRLTQAALLAQNNATARTAAAAAATTITNNNPSDGGGVGVDVNSEEASAGGAAPEGRKPTASPQPHEEPHTFEIGDNTVCAFYIVCLFFCFLFYYHYYYYYYYL